MSNTKVNFKNNCNIIALLYFSLYEIHHVSSEWFVSQFYYERLCNAPEFLEHRGVTFSTYRIYKTNVHIATRDLIKSKIKLKNPWARGVRTWTRQMTGAR